jgi:hypothetical protein
MSLKVQKGGYFVLTYWDREKKKRIQKYIGKDKDLAEKELIHALVEKRDYYQRKIDSINHDANWDIFRKMKKAELVEVIMHYLHYRGVSDEEINNRPNAPFHSYYGRREFNLKSLAKGDLIAIAAILP